MPLIGPEGLPDIGRGSEGLKNTAMQAVHLLGLTGSLGEAVSRCAGVRTIDERLTTKLAGITFENPVMVGAGEDKTGRTVDGWHVLGFSGVEVGTVVPAPQPGNPRPRLFYDKTSGVALNSMGFNSPGAEAVAAELARRKHRGVVGISVGKNKLTEPDDAARDHAEAARILFAGGDYFVVNLSSPNTPHLRKLLQSRYWLREIIQTTQEAVPGKPVLIKVTVDLGLKDLNRALGVAVELGVAGVIGTNTTTNEATKARYGWAGRPGGVSGNDPDFRRRADAHMQHITKETCGTGLVRIGVGAINDGPSAVKRIRGGAELVQAVTGLRKNPLLARTVNRALLRELDRESMTHVSQLVGVDAPRL